MKIFTHQSHWGMCHHSVGSNNFYTAKILDVLTQEMDHLHTTNKLDVGWVISESQTATHCPDLHHYGHWQGREVEHSCHSVLQSRRKKYHKLRSISCTELAEEGRHTWILGMSLTNNVLPLMVAFCNSVVALDARSAESNDKNAVPENE